MPEISLVVVPLLPASRVEEEADKPYNPFPWMNTRPISASTRISMPSFRKQSIVERQSAPSRKLVISETPSAKEANITLRWEMDLSPGTVIVPFNFLPVCKFIVISPCLFLFFFIDAISFVFE